MMQKIRWFLLVLAVIVALAIALQNNETTTIQLFFFKQQLQLSLLILLALGVGFVLGSIMTYLMLRSRKKSKAKVASVKPAKQPDAVNELTKQG